MFESDDFDQILSQFELPGELSNDRKEGINDREAIQDVHKSALQSPQLESNEKICSPKRNLKKNDDTFPISYKPQYNSNEITQSKETFVSPKHTKRKFINKHFDHNSKRKFPGPAGLLTGTLEEDKDESISHMELLSQDLEFSQNNTRDLFKTPIWLHLLKDIQSWKINNIDSIRSIKQQAKAGNLRLRKAKTVTAFVELIDRSATDPLIILRDATGHIKCTLHRDAWSTFAPYIVSEYCALMLRRPTVLTTGSAFKKHYLNITLSNIYAVYSSAVVREGERQLPEGYERNFEEEFTVIKMKNPPQDMGATLVDNSNNGINEDNNLLDDLDSIFSDDLF